MADPPHKSVQKVRLRGMTDTPPRPRRPSPCRMRIVRFSRFANLTLTTLVSALMVLEMDDFRMEGGISKDATRELRPIASISGGCVRNGVIAGRH